MSIEFSEDVRGFKPAHEDKLNFWQRKITLSVYVRFKHAGRLKNETETSPRITQKSGMYSEGAMDLLNRNNITKSNNELSFQTTLSFSTPLT